MKKLVLVGLLLAATFIPLIISTADAMPQIGPPKIIGWFIVNTKTNSHRFCLNPEKTYCISQREQFEIIGEPVYDTYRFILFT